MCELTYNRVLFAGDSCYPMSPFNDDTEAGEEEQDPNEALLTDNDQLVLICKKLITSKTSELTDKDRVLLFSFITDPAALVYQDNILNLTKDRSKKDEKADSSQ